MAMSLWPHFLVHPVYNGRVSVLGSAIVVNPTVECVMIHNAAYFSNAAARRISYEM